MQVQLLLNPHPPAPARVLAAPAALSALSFDRPSLTGARPPLMAPQHICPTAPAGPSGPDVHLPPGRPLRQRRAALSTWKPLHPSSALREEGSQWPAGRPAGRTQGDAAVVPASRPQSFPSPLHVGDTGHHKHSASLGVSSAPCPALCTPVQETCVSPSPPTHVLQLLCPRRPSLRPCLSGVLVRPAPAHTHPFTAAHTVPEQSEPQTPSRTRITSAPVFLKRGSSSLLSSPPCCLCQLQREQRKCQLTRTYTLVHTLAPLC